MPPAGRDRHDTRNLYPRYRRANAAPSAQRSFRRLACVEVFERRRAAPRPRRQRAAGAPARRSPRFKGAVAQNASVAPRSGAFRGFAHDNLAPHNCHFGASRQVDEKSTWVNRRRDRDPLPLVSSVQDVKARSLKGTESATFKASVTVIANLALRRRAPCNFGPCRKRETAWAYVLKASIVELRSRSARLARD